MYSAETTTSANHQATGTRTAKRFAETALVQRDENDTICPTPIKKINGTLECKFCSRHYLWYRIILYPRNFMRHNMKIRSAIFTLFEKKGVTNFIRINNYVSHFI